MTGDFQTIRRLWISLLERFSRMNFGLAIVVALLTFTGFMTLFSAGYSYPWRVADQARNILIALLVLIVFANIHPRYLIKMAIPLYVTGVLLLLATLVAGTTIKGATRWLNLGVAQIQPSELMKLALPLMLAWFFQNRGDRPGAKDFIAAFMMIAVPVALIMKQPDLGTAILVATAGLSVVFFAGLPWKWILVMVGSTLASLPFIWNFVLHDYQRQRIITLIDPTSDPLGKGFHTLQALIAIGSGGVFGKGWMEGTQAHLDFIPERTSDFLFAVFSEEFGLVGNITLLVLYFILICTAMRIAVNAANTFSKLLAGAISVIFFTYTFVNMGMVSGILPVVGVPLPFMSYGGTALITLGTCTGILMAISANKKYKDD
ncbi:MAG: rod shape-determining protein RodA [Mesosutterella sp.]|nr:rod shape-determining protein RodA [Mesosutterella sp.]